MSGHYDVRIAVRRDASYEAIKWDIGFVEDANGLIILFARIRDPDVREIFWSHLEDLPGERIGSTIYELNIADWDQGLWQEEIERIHDLLAGTRERIVVWQFEESRYARYTIADS